MGYGPVSKGNVIYSGLMYKIIVVTLQLLVVDRFSDYVYNIYIPVLKLIADSSQ